MSQILPGTKVRPVGQVLFSKSYNLRRVPTKQIYQQKVKKATTRRKIVIQCATRLKSRKQVQEEQLAQEQHTITLIGKVGSPILEDDEYKARVFWLVTPSIDKPASEEYQFVVKTFVPNEKWDELTQDIEEEDSVFVQGQLKDGRFLFVSGIRIESQLYDRLKKLPSLNKIYQREPMPRNVQDGDVPTYGNQRFEHLILNIRDYWDMRMENTPGSRQPQFKHRTLKNKSGIWLDDTNVDFYERLLQRGFPMNYPGWMLYELYPDEFWDNEPYKATPKSPTFIHKATGCCIWYDEETATDLQKSLYKRTKDKNYRGKRPTDPWKDLEKNPGDWMDVRGRSSNPRAPAFRHKVYRNGVGLWLDTDKVPADILEKIEGNQLAFKAVPTSQEHELWWRDLFNNSKKWNDFRQEKANKKRHPSYPDFKSAVDDRSLWVDNNDTPDWVKQKVEEFQVAR